MVALAIPVKINGKNLQAAIWAVGLKHQVPESSVTDMTDLLKAVSQDLNCRLQ
jgi:IclR family KDG regulon transcriptional repressor